MPFFNSRLLFSREVFKRALSRPWARAVLAFFTIVGLWDTIVSQLLPPDLATTAPNVYSVLSSTSGYLSWQIWLALGAVLLVGIAFEYAYRKHTNAILASTILPPPEKEAAKLQTKMRVGGTSNAPLGGLIAKMVDLPPLRGLDLAIAYDKAAQRLRQLAHAESISIYGITDRGQLPQKIPKDFWANNQIALMTALNPESSEVHTEPAVIGQGGAKYINLFIAPESAEIALAAPLFNEPKKSKIIPFGGPSLFAYINGNERVRELDQLIAKRLGKQFDNTSSERAGLKTLLKKFEIQTINDLEELVERHHDDIVEMACYASVQGDVPKGHSLMVLTWILGAKMGVEKYAALVGAGWANEMCKAYAIVRGST